MVSKFLDKPSLHRLVELYQFYIPCFGHVLQIKELYFEWAHQPLKRCRRRSSHHHSHFLAVEHVLSNDWQGRMVYLYHLMRISSSCTSSSASTTLLRFLLAQKMYPLNEKLENEKQVLERFKEQTGASHSFLSSYKN